MTPADRLIIAPHLDDEVLGVGGHGRGQDQSDADQLAHVTSWGVGYCSRIPMIFH